MEEIKNLMEKKEVEKLMDTVDIVSESLELAKKNGLDAEVVTWALITIKEDPSIEIEQAIKIALEEWVK